MVGCPKSQVPEALLEDSLSLSLSLITRFNPFPLTNICRSSLLHVLPIHLSVSFSVFSLYKKHTNTLRYKYLSLSLSVLSTFSSTITGSLFSAASLPWPLLLSNFFVCCCLYVRHVFSKFISFPKGGEDAWKWLLSVIIGEVASFICCLVFFLLKFALVSLPRYDHKLYTFLMSSALKIFFHFGRV